MTLTARLAQLFVTERLLTSQLFAKTLGIFDASCGSTSQEADVLHQDFEPLIDGRTPQREMRIEEGFAMKKFVLSLIAVAAIGCGGAPPAAPVKPAMTPPPSSGPTTPANTPADGEKKPDAAPADGEKKPDAAPADGEKKPDADGEKKPDAADGEKKEDK